MSELDGVKAKDRLIVYGRGDDRVVTVERVTNTQIRLTDQTRWSKKTCQRVPRPVFSWSGTECLKVASLTDIERLAERAEIRRLASRIADLWKEKRIHDRSVEQLKALAAALGDTEC